MDWREAAKGIPVWEGAAVWFEGKRWRVTRLWPSVNGHEDRANLDCLDDSGDGETPPISDAIPDLTDPDTRAAYDRRLALELGCPAHTADCGVVVGWSRGLLTVWAGIPDTGAEPGDIVWPFERAVPAPKDADRLAARALAWPADKRVGG